ncbi:helix-turn-helix transcriptional regulator [Spiractinospora alimapuensis]|uniref:helix-turn-helix domain-containing protein n=1 Tax=Spiractinospora alimapuensis TaxID=2820884 RepID=UPI001F2B484A|nr:helix-turn-helix transcriptional regulator [Spiractinospora alimapuensis]QVQ50863.1 helix-turn-helix transcriptional regulator [Spiractinospora alimapuensis]
MTSEAENQWHEFSNELRHYRTKEGITQVTLGAAVNMSGSMISAIENGTREPKRSHAEAMDTALSTDGKLTRLWLDINNNVDVPAWWRDIGLLEREAVEIREYTTTFIPGLLQTEEYARTFMTDARPWATPMEIDQDVRARVKRRGELNLNPLLWYVVDEVALKRVVGSRELIHDQLTHIITLMDASSLKLQIIPEYAPHHPGMNGNFRVLRFTGRTSVVLVEHLLGEEVVENAEQINRCETLFGALQAEALSLTESGKMIKKIREDFAP